jgi:hypothetical protein
LLRPALIRDPLRRQLAEKVGDRGRFFIVTLGYDDARPMPLLVKVNRGYGHVIGFMGTLEPAADNGAALAREAALTFVTAHNAKDVGIKALAGRDWCHGADPKYIKKADRDKSWAPDPVIEPYRPFTGLGKRERGPLPAEIDRVVAFDDQRRALWLREPGQRALDKLVGPEAFVIFLGRPDDKSAFTTLLVRITRDAKAGTIQASVVGTLDGLQ